MISQKVDIVFLCINYLLCISSVDNCYIHTLRHRHPRWVGRTDIVSAKEILEPVSLCDFCVPVILHT